MRTFENLRWMGFSFTMSLLVILAFGIGHRTAAAQTPGGDVIFLNQAWAQGDREWYYQFSQGSTILSYDIFLNLEVAGGQELFRSNANSERYGLITQPANSSTNPDGLPIGLAKTVISSPRFKGDGPGVYVGPNCAACHNAQLYYKGKRIRIDGGVANTFDFMAYFQALDDALQATLKDPAKFDRLTAKQQATSPDSKAQLRKRFESDAALVHAFRTRTVAPNPWGPARMDAIALIINRLTAVMPNIPENWTTPQAPTKPPFLWNAPQGLWTQWRAVQQDPIERNLIETMGVFMNMDLHSKTRAEGLFESNAEIGNLRVVENLLNRLAPPSWPEEVFGKIDRDKAKAGKSLFMTHCASCHNIWPYRWTEPNKYGKQWILVGLTPQSYVGTDPEQFREVRPLALTNQLAPNLPGPLKDKELVGTGELYYTLVKEILGTALAKVKFSEAETLDMHGYREFPLARPMEAVYKAAPRDGVWATPPFMHNGSVPNLYEMLLPASQRTKKFCYGREFDPVKVGFETACKPGAFEVDTALRGNSNGGHSFEDGPKGRGVIGPSFTEEERWALVEYLKSIPEEPGRVTPFGGPAAANAAKPGWTPPR
jgi:mono/diheme cytochrome c family protein